MLVFVCGHLLEFRWSLGQSVTGGGLANSVGCPTQILALRAIVHGLNGQLAQVASLASWVCR